MSNVAIMLWLSFSSCFFFSRLLKIAPKFCLITFLSSFEIPLQLLIHFVFMNNSLQIICLFLCNLTLSSFQYNFIVPKCYTKKYFMLLDSIFIRVQHSSSFFFFLNDCSLYAKHASYQQYRYSTYTIGIRTMGIISIIILFFSSNLYSIL